MKTPHKAQELLLSLGEELKVLCEANAASEAERETFGAERSAFDAQKAALNAENAALQEEIRILQKRLVEPAPAAPTSEPPALWSTQHPVGYDLNKDAGPVRDKDETSSVGSRGAHSSHSDATDCSQHRRAGNESLRRTGRRTSFVQYYEQKISVAAPEVESNEEDRRSLKSILQSPEFDLAIGGLILVNTFCMAAEMQYQGIEAGFVAKYSGYNKPAKDVWPHAAAVFEVLERMFTLIFTFELVIRIVVFRCKFFRDALNWIDIVAVLVGLMDWIWKANVAVNPMMARMLRVAKLARGLRLAKMTKVASSLQLLMKSITASVTTLSWSVLLLLLVQMVAGMMLSQLVHDFIIDSERDILERQLVFSYYGTFSRSQITMFEIHLANFAPACRVLLDSCGEGYAAIFLAYRCLAGFAILNVINAVFIQQTMGVAQRDHEIGLQLREKAIRAYSKDLKALFNELDISGDGTLSYEELQRIVSKPELVLWMNALEINTGDLQALFELLDVDGDNSITADELCAAAPRLRGSARSIDMLVVLSQLESIKNRLEAHIMKDRRSSSRNGKSIRQEDNLENNFVEQENLGAKAYLAKMQSSTEIELPALPGKPHEA